MKVQSSCQEGKKYKSQDSKCSCENKDIGRLCQCFQRTGSEHLH
jgi:hypothetical protein